MENHIGLDREIWKRTCRGTVNDRFLLLKEVGGPGRAGGCGIYECSSTLGEDLDSVTAGRPSSTLYI